MFTGIINVNVWNFYLPFFPTFSSYFWTLNFCLSKKQYKVLLEYLGKFWSTDVANRLAIIAWRGFYVNHNSYGLRAAYSPRVDPLSTWLWKKRGSEVQKVASMRLKIGQRVGIGLAVIATRASNACQNSYGFGAIWSQIFFRRKIY